MMEINDLPAEIMLKIFGKLLPEDLKTSLLVRKWWRELGEDPALWTWCVVIVRNREDIENLSIRRLRKVREIRVKLGASGDDEDWEVDDSEDGDLEALFQATLRLPWLKTIDGLEGKDLSSVELDLLVSSLIKLDQVDLRDTKLSTEKMSSILTCVANEDTKLKRLNLRGNKLSSVESSLLSRALARQEEVDLRDTMLSAEQMTVILRNEAHEHTNLNTLNLWGIDLSTVEPEVIGQAVNRMEDVDLSYTWLNTDQITAILSLIPNQDTKLKRLNLKRNDLSTVEPEEIARALHRLEDINLGYTQLNDDQIRSIFACIANQDTTLKRLNLWGIDLSTVEAEVIVRAVARLEDVNLGYTKLSNDQITTILTLVAHQDTNLKRLNLEPGGTID